ncbi:erv26 super protein [Coemansia sp. RSA 1813]|nr:erv26 super protein [Coemansia sp. RSA 1646]KAJ1772548.1 erv26 super protein [Coemansia sp. RSA 1843]KAJ2085597.1 erv26 super protein [Coemansia sp. RSA 986]KAJ2211933.1 erv26 super protein [Coemansia sp. RSA 487]KAJ2571223.1 erv26 super protein [Coemansia sp. RSA 1813]
MAFLAGLVTAGWLAGVVFLLFSVGCGLYVLSEWVEEHPRITRRLLWYTVWAVDVVLVLMAVDGLSIWRILVSLCTNHIYATNLEGFPLVNLGGAKFLSSCALAISNHFLWFFYFIQRLSFPFSQVCSFMFFCVWLVPLALFVSLVPIDTALPSAQTSERGKTRQNMFKTLFSRFAKADSEQQQPLHVE